MSEATRTEDVMKEITELVHNLLNPALKPDDRRTIIEMTNGACEGVARVRAMEQMAKA